METPRSLWVCVCVCVYKTQQAVGDTEGPSRALLFNRRIQGTSRTLKTTWEQSLSHTLSRPVYPFWCLPADLWYLVLVMSQPTLFLCVYVCVFITHTRAQRQGAKGHNNIVSMRQWQSCSNVVWGAVGWMIRAHTLIQLVGRGHSEPAKLRDQGSLLGITPGNPSWAMAWFLSAKGECQPAGLFRCHRSVCVWLCAQTHTHILCSENECVLSGGFLSGNHNRRLYIKMSNVTIARQNWLQKKLDVTNLLWMMKILTNHIKGYI